MKPDHDLAKEYFHIPACLKKFSHPNAPPSSNPSSSVQTCNPSSMERPVDPFPEEESCEQKVQRKIAHDLATKRISKAKELGLNQDSVTFLDEEDEGGANMIVCSNGNCKFLNTHLVMGTSNSHWGEINLLTEGKCIQRSRDEIECKNNADNENSANKKVF